jgi:hypothetical protein
MFSRLTAITKINAALFSLCLLICSIFISWVLWAQVNFAYPVLHWSMNIEQHIDKYGPQNRYRDDFEKTDKQEQVRLFATIVDAIHNDGKGLERITYRNQSGQPISTLLRQAEVIHLQDVAHLISTFYTVSIIVILLTCLLIGVFKYQGTKLPSLKQQAVGILGFTIISFILIMLIGPVSVFYALHEWIFPDNHQWFFYYQESLMTVLMKAPDLFGAITGLIAALAIPIYLLLNRLVLIIPSKSTKK